MAQNQKKSRGPKFKLDKHSWKSLVPALLVVVGGLAYPFVRDEFFPQNIPTPELNLGKEESAVATVDSLSPTALDQTALEADRAAERDSQEKTRTTQTKLGGEIGVDDIRSVYKANDELLLEKNFDQNFHELAGAPGKAKQRAAMERLIAEQPDRISSWKGSLKAAANNGVFFLQVYDARLEKQDSTDSLPTDELCWKFLGALNDGSRSPLNSACSIALREREGVLFVSVDLERSDENPAAHPRMAFSLPDKNNSTTFLYNAANKSWLAGAITWEKISPEVFRAETSKQQ